MKLDHMVVLVPDLQASLPFYETLLGLIGFHKEREYVFGNIDGVYLDIKQATDPDHRYRRHAPGVNHIGFTAPSRAALVDIRQRMSEVGFAVPDIQELGPESSLFFKDPYGMRVELTVYGDGAN